MREFQHPFPLQFAPRLVISKKILSRKGKYINRVATVEKWMKRKMDGQKKGRIFKILFERCSKFYLAKKVSSSLTTFDLAIMIIAVIMIIFS